VEDALNYQAGLRQFERAWQATPEAFAQLLNWLDSGMDSQGRKYEEMRQRLVTYFDRKNCRMPDELADETLNRVMKWLVQNRRELDTEPAKICYNTARFVFHEYLRRPEHAQDEIDELPRAQQPAEDPRLAAGLTEEQENKEKRLQCLDRCSAKLPTDDRELIVRYYYGEQRTKLDNRKLLAAERGMTANALTIKACRVRDKLRSCVLDCVCA
jgi:DNA-directed RNA polymerase specialized sigma24 family protein